MGCSDCFKDKRKHGTWYDQVCDVCFLVDGDEMVKRVQYCRNCKAFVCEGCKGKYGKRFVAMIESGRKMLMERIKK